jgi:hypothetical protein
MRVSFRQNLLPEKGGFTVERKLFSVEQIMAVQAAGFCTAERRGKGIRQELTPPAS